MGTPLFINVPRVRANRATSIFRIKLAEDRQLQLALIDPQPALGTAGVTPESPPGRSAGAQDGPPVEAHGIAEAQQQTGRQRDRGPHVGEDDRELGNHESEQNDDRDPAHQDQEHGVDQGGLDEILEILGALQEDPQPGEHRLQHPAGLAGPDHVHVEAGKHFRVLGQRIGEIAAPLNRFEHLGDHGLEPLLLGDPRNDAEGPVHRQTRFQQGGEVLGEDHQVLAGDPAQKRLGEAGNPEIQPAAAFSGGRHPDGDQPHVVELAHRAPLLGRFQHSLGHLPGRVGGLVDERCHPISPASPATPRRWW